MGRTEITRNFKSTFTLTEPELRRIYEILVQQMDLVSSDHPIVSFKINHANEIAEEQGSLEEVLKVDNGGAWKITHLKIVLNEGLRSFGNANHIEIRFGKSQSYQEGNIEYKIGGEDRDWVYLTSSKINDRIEKLQSKFKLLDSVSWFTFVFPYLLFTFLLLGISIGYGIKSGGKSDYQILIPPKYLVETAVLLVFIGLFFLVYKLCFSHYSFCWGDQVEVITRKKAIGNFFFVVVIIGMVLNILATFLYNIIFS